jgi:hypothetical protein
MKWHGGLLGTVEPENVTGMLRGFRAVKRKRSRREPNRGWARRSYWMQQLILPFDAHGSLKAK